MFLVDNELRGFFSRVSKKWLLSIVYDQTTGRCNFTTVTLFSRFADSTAGFVRHSWVFFSFVVTVQSARVLANVMK